MKEKLQFLLKSKGLSASTLANMLEIQPSGISHLMSGRNKPSFDLVVKILKVFPDINPDWLLLDKGEMNRSSMSNNSPTLEEAAPAATLDGSLFDQSRNTQFSETSDEAKNEQSNIFAASQHGSQSSVFSALNIVGSSKVPQRVIVLYADGSFESFTASKPIR